MAYRDDEAAASVRDQAIGEQLVQAERRLGKLRDERSIRRRSKTKLAAFTATWVAFAVTWWVLLDRFADAARGRDAVGLLAIFGVTFLAWIFAGAFLGVSWRDAIRPYVPLDDEQQLADEVASLKSRRPRVRVEDGQEAVENEAVVSEPSARAHRETNGG